MNKESTVLPWHEAAGKEIGSLYWAAQQDDDFPQDSEAVAIIAAHDPHAATETATLRLLEATVPFVSDAGASSLTDAIRAHLATLSKPDETKGSK